MHRLIWNDSTTDTSYEAAVTKRHPGVLALTGLVKCCEQASLGVKSLFKWTEQPAGEC